MAQTLPIHFKATGEHFDVSYRMQTTIYQLIEYVCNHSTVLLTINPENYYMAINNSDVLDDDRTVEGTGLDQSNRFYSLAVCMKTSILMDRILQSHRRFWQTSTENISQTTQTSSVEATSNDDDDMTSDEVHVLVCGGLKVGKSSLINAFCGCPIAKTSTIGLDPCTQRTSYYQLDNIFFWDTPGIQNWSKLDIDSYLNSSKRPQTPICMFYCASPGSFARLKQLEILLDECIHQRNIFCVLVVTNMFVHPTRHDVLNEFKNLLRKYVDIEQQIREEHGVWYYGKVGLCTMVNSQEYIDEDIDRKHPEQGINELVLAVTKSLSETHQLAGWLRDVPRKNRTFSLVEKTCEILDFEFDPIAS